MIATEARTSSTSFRVTQCPSTEACHSGSALRAPAPLVSPEPKEFGNKLEHPGPSTPKHPGPSTPEHPAPSTPRLDPLLVQWETWVARGWGAIHHEPRARLAAYRFCPL
jgi:hypothetical protein